MREEYSKKHLLDPLRSFLLHWVVIYWYSAQIQKNRSDHVQSSADNTTILHPKHCALCLFLLIQYLKHAAPTNPKTSSQLRFVFRFVNSKKNYVKFQQIYSPLEPLKVMFFTHQDCGAANKFTFVCKVLHKFLVTTSKLVIYWMRCSIQTY